MRQSKLFGKTIREAPKDEVSSNAQLLERGGFIYKSMAGVYEYLPLGFRVLEKINGIIREKINEVGGQELLLSSLQPKERWQKTGRWDVMKDIMYQFKDHSDREIGLATTHEEVLTEIASRYIHSYKDLPLSVYQIQTKFRDEPRAKSGLIRGREFLMKDLYSFHRNEEDLAIFYESVKEVYENIFDACNLDAYITEASGGTFTKNFTHEFQVLSPAGEDWIFYCIKCRFAQNKEVTSLKEGDACPKCNHTIAMGRSIEVGNIFTLGTKFSEAFGLYYSDEEGNKQPVVMGSYGIGPGRLLGTVVETHHDDKGIIWPEALAPYRGHLIALGGKNPNVKEQAEKLYKQFLQRGVEILYDDRDDKTAGEKFADADLIGIPWRIIISERTIADNKAELQLQHSKQPATLVSLDEIGETFP